LVLDLRQNPGGYLDAAVNIADEFIDGRKLLVYTTGRQHKRTEYNSRRRGMFESGKLAVLIDEGSASASEIVSGAIQDWDRGMIIGRRSFGKGLVQEQYDLSNKGALRLTVARYYTPSGRCIQKPYDEGRESYQQEIEERIAQSHTNTDSTSVNDDSLLYETLVKKRKVYGGGGVSPDIFVPIDTTSNETFLIRTRSLLPEFIYDYYSHHRSEFDAFSTFEKFEKNYQISEELFNEFKQYIQQEVGFVDEALLQRDRNKLQVYMRAYLARQQWGNDGFYPIIHTLDLVLEEAQQQLSNQTAK